MSAFHHGQPIPLRPDPSAMAASSMASLTRAAVACGRAKIDRTTSPLQQVRSFGDGAAEMLVRAASSPMSLANTPALAQVGVAFLSALAPLSAGSDLLGRAINLNFNGAASITVPGIAIPVADFVGENMPVPIQTAPTTAGPTLAMHVIKCIIVASNELLASGAAETLLQQVLVEAVGPSVDKVLFSTAAAGADRPAGLLNGISALTPTAVTGSKSDALQDDIQKLATAIAPVAGNSTVAIIAAPAQAVAVALRLARPVPYALLTSSSLASGTVIAVATNSIVAALAGAPVIDAGSDASVHYDTVPAAIVGSGGQIAAPTGSFFQTDVVGLRLRWPISWAVRDPRGIAWMSGVNW
jgi:hypothetical protein